ncbi:hypothetical protein N5D_03900 [Enterococcus faecalis]|nr:hypothetical protein N5D_03900 [Enterococcus faecalis]
MKPIKKSKKTGAESNMPKKTQKKSPKIFKILKTKRKKKKQQLRKKNKKIKTKEANCVSDSDGEKYHQHSNLRCKLGFEKLLNTQ